MAGARLPDDLDPAQPAARLSGGQAMVALSGAWASGADWLILTNPATTSMAAIASSCTNGCSSGAAACW